MYNIRSKFESKSSFVEKVRTICAKLSLSKRTEQAYVHWIVEFIFHFNNRHPAEMGTAEVTQYLSWLATEKKASASQLRQAEGALNLMLQIKRKSHRSRDNILTASEIDATLKSLPQKYRVILDSIHNFKSLRELAKVQGVHHNSVALMLRCHSRNQTGKSVSVQGFKRSVMLREIAGGLQWSAAEKKYGAQTVKTACAEFVRMLSPKILVENLAS